MEDDVNIEDVLSFYNMVTMTRRRTMRKMVKDDDDDGDGEDGDGDYIMLLRVSTLQCFHNRVSRTPTFSNTMVSSSTSSQSP